MTEPADLPQVWQRITNDLRRDRIISAQSMAFLGQTKPVGVLDGIAFLAVPDNLTRDMVEQRLREHLVSALSQAFSQPVRIAITVDPEVVASLTSQESQEQDPVDHQGNGSPSAGHSSDAFDARFDDTVVPLPPHVNRRARDAHRHVEPARLNPKYTFDTFVIGASNRFAHAASVAVAEAPAKAYNPLFVYGESGLGKTHLLHAIGDYAQHLYTGVRVRYVNSEEFTNEFINSIRDDKASTFQRRYRDVDVLLIDDIQFLQGKVQTQEEFFHTFNTLHNANKQVVITSDLPPKQLSGFEERMRSRFEWGLITDVQPPDLETRIAILRKKAVGEGLQAPDDVLEYIASKISTNIRELEGALIRVTAFANLNRQLVDLQLAEIVLKDLISDDGGHEITSATIMAQTADYFGLTIEDLTGTSRSRVLVTARQIAMYLCREMTDLSLPKIGQAFRRTRPHHGDARQPQGARADGGAPLDLQPGHRADEPDPAAAS